MPNPFLAPSDVVDFERPSIRELAVQLRDAGGVAGCAERCFNWVRDEVQHSNDTDRDVVTCRASDVLRERVGLCYAKCHLLVALLRAGGVPAGFCYQRLAVDDAGKFCLHGLAALERDDGTWYRVDPRGGVRGANARFDPPREHLVYPANAPGEYDLAGVFAEPLDQVIVALRAHSSLRDLMRALPDVAPGGSGSRRNP